MLGLVLSSARSARLLIVAAIAAVGLMGGAPIAGAVQDTPDTTSAKVAAKTSDTATPAPLGASVPAVSPLPVPAGCTLTNLCFWVDAGWVDGPGRLSGSNPNWAVFAHSSCVPPHALGTRNGTWSDCASSIYNHGANCTAHVYFWENYVAPRLDIPRGYGQSNLANEPRSDGGNWNDNIRSNNWC